MVAHCRGAAWRRLDAAPPGAPTYFLPL